MELGGQNRRTLAAFWLLGLLNNSGAKAIDEPPSAPLCNPTAAPLLPPAAAACRLVSHLASLLPPLYTTSAAYVIMLAGANSISAAAVGLVYLAAVGPSLLCKVCCCCPSCPSLPSPSLPLLHCRFPPPLVPSHALHFNPSALPCTPTHSSARPPHDSVQASAPYWFHRVRYTTRMHAAAVLMAASYTTGGCKCTAGWAGWLVGGCVRPGGGTSYLPPVLKVGYNPPTYRPPTHAPPTPQISHLTNSVALSSSRGWQLLGVVFASLQGGLGEASCLALTSHYRYIQWEGGPVSWIELQQGGGAAERIPGGAECPFCALPCCCP